MDGPEMGKMGPAENELMAGHAASPRMGHLQAMVRRVASGTLAKGMGLAPRLLCGHPHSRAGSEGRFSREAGGDQVATSAKQAVQPDRGTPTLRGAFLPPSEVELTRLSCRPPPEVENETAGRGRVTRGDIGGTPWTA